MRVKFLISIAAFFSLSTTQASPVLLAHGSLPAIGSDLSGLSAPLENGAPGDFLGGFGSGIGHAGGGTFLAIPDRGPNAVSFNPLIDDTASYIDRFQTLKLQLTPAASGSTLPFNLTPALTATTLLSSTTPLVYGTGALGTGMSGGKSYTLGSGIPALNAVNNTNYFTGRSDGFDPSMNSMNPSNGRFDPESIRVSNDGKSIFISDEYGPSIYQFDRSTGQRIRTFPLPSYFGVRNLSSRGSTEISGNTQGRLANKGMEGMAITPDGKTLVGIMQSPLIQDGGASSVNVRIVTIDIASGAITHSYVYKLANANNTVSEIVAVNDHRFLVDERDGDGGLAATTKQLFLIDVTGATDVKAEATLPAGFTPVAKGAQPFLDLLDPAYGLKNTDFPPKIEGVAFGDDIVVNGLTEHTLWITNYNDFDGRTMDNFYVFGIDPADLPDYQGQTFAATPEPQSFALLGAGLGLLGCCAFRRTSRSQRD